MEFIKPVVSKDNRRILSNLLKADIKDINYWEARKGSILGNHYHRKTVEYFFITKGSGLLTLDDKRHLIIKGSFFKVKPLEKHSIECLSNLNFLTFLSEPYDESNPDIYK